tara:strand:- start:1197 stop:1511 length:315 start_codon:yes stop_codon:yes gene_type:complete
MKLTGKAKEDFGMWHFDRGTPIKEYKSFIELSDTCINAVIIEFFDSVGITIDVMPILNNHIKWMPNTFCIEKEITTEDAEYYETRNESIEKAIEKANEIYNELL